jgi:hypothetical protein
MNEKLKKATGYSDDDAKLSYQEFKGKHNPILILLR